MDKHGLMSRGQTNLTNPEAVLEIHREYAQCGCRALTMTMNRIYIETHHVVVERLPSTFVLWLECWRRSRIRDCVRKKGIKGCWECSGFEDCELLEPLSIYHGDTPKYNLRLIKEYGIEN